MKMGKRRGAQGGPDTENLPSWLVGWTPRAYLRKPNRPDTCLQENSYQIMDLIGFGDWKREKLK